MNANDILSRKGREVVTVDPTATVATAVKLLAERNIGALIITETDGDVVGIISERDIVRMLNESGAASLALPVLKTMTRKVETCTESVTDIELMELMTKGKFRHVPVAEHGHLVGVLSIGDVVKARLQELEGVATKVEAVTASIAHEVRQPVAAIAANSGAALRFLDNTPPNHHEIRSALNRIIADCHRTSEMLDSIRTLFRTVTWKKQPLAVNEIIGEVIQSLHGELQDHGVIVQLDLASELPSVEGHSGQLQEVIYNLIHNAIESMDTATDRSRMLRVRTELYDREMIQVSVEDSGPGIDPKQLDRIFDPFVTTKTHGTGLGLAICRMIVERHGGRLSALSDGTNGALFHFSLPIGLMQDAATS